MKNERNNAIQITPEIARAAGTDAANRQMRKAGRQAWNRADYNLAARTMNAILDSGWKVEDYRLATSTGRHIRIATKVTTPAGKVVKFIDRLGKKEAIRQAAMY